MNLRAYYQQLRSVEESLTDPFVVLESHQTPDGGRAGVLTEVPRHLAAKLIAEGRAHVARAEAAQAFLEQKAEAKRISDQEATAAQMHVTLVPAEPKRPSRSGKE